MSNAADNLMSLDIVPVRCPVCGEAQNTLDGATDPMTAGRADRLHGMRSRLRG